MADWMLPTYDSSLRNVLAMTGPSPRQLSLRQISPKSDDPEVGARYRQMGRHSHILSPNACSRL